MPDFQSLPYRLCVATAVFNRSQTRKAQIHPDGHGVWTAAGYTVGFFLEHDRGTEDVPRVLRGLEKALKY